APRIPGLQQSRRSYSATVKDCRAAAEGKSRWTPSISPFPEEPGEQKSRQKLISDFIALANQQSFTVIVRIVMRGEGVKPPIRVSPRFFGARGLLGVVRRPGKGQACKMGKNGRTGSERGSRIL